MIKAESFGFYHDEWCAPVNIRVGYGASELVRGPAQAYEYLTTKWPMERGPHYEMARQVCIAAVERRDASERAREAFIAASIEAYVLA